jgi:hypothetical protein
LDQAFFVLFRHAECHWPMSCSGGV